MSAHLSVGVVRVNSWSRTVDYSLIFRGEADIGLNSPSVQSEANMAQDRLRANREIGRRAGSVCPQEGIDKLR